jgi:outer membrane protein assembly factor BamB
MRANTSDGLTAELVLVGGDDGVLRALDARTGHQLWTDQAPAAIAAGVTLTTDTLVTASGFQIPGSGPDSARAGVLAYRLPPT